MIWERDESNAGISGWNRVVFQLTYTPVTLFANAPNRTAISALREQCATIAPHWLLRGFFCFPAGLAPTTPEKTPVFLFYRRTADCLLN